MKKTMMSVVATAIVLATGSAFAQTPAPTVPATPPAAFKMDAATDAKFKAADKDKSGTLEGVEVDAYKADMTKIDTNKDSKVSPAEFDAAVKSGLIK